MPEPAWAFEADGVWRLRCREGRQGSGLRSWTWKEADGGCLVQPRTLTSSLLCGVLPQPPLMSSGLAARVWAWAAPRDLCSLAPGRVTVSCKGWRGMAAARFPLCCPRCHGQLWAGSPRPDRVLAPAGLVPSRGLRGLRGFPPQGRGLLPGHLRIPTDVSGGCVF